MTARSAHQFGVSLVVPADRPAMLAKAGQRGADLVILDLEDAVLDRHKDEARQAVRTRLADPDFATQPTAVRLNGWESRALCEDVRVLLEPGSPLRHVVLPKVEAAEHLLALDQVLTQAERRAGLDVGCVKVSAVIESARGVDAVSAIASSCSRLIGLVLGPLDLAHSLGVPAAADGLPSSVREHVLLRLVITGRAHNLGVIDGPCIALDPESAVREAASARALGCHGKWVVHPSQIRPVKEIFAPSRTDLIRARRVLDAVAAAELSGEGSSQHDGVMVDEASRRWAIDVLGASGSGHLPDNRQGSQR